MAEGFDIEGLGKKINEITSALDAIKTQNALGIGDTSRFLINISEKLDNLSGSTPDNTETLNLVSDLKKSLEDRYSFINVKFTELESAFKNVTKMNEDLVTNTQIKELFDILSTNLSVFSKQVMAQGDILNEITLRIEALRTDDSNKRDIIKSVTSLKNDLDKFNNGFESIVLNINHNYDTLMEQISHLDPTSEVNEMKTFVGDIKTTSDTILSAMQIVDKKQNSLSDSIEEVVSQNTKINANIKALAGQSDFDGLVQKVEAAIEIIKTLREVLTETNEQSQKALLLHLDKLSSTVSRILTEEDFELFKNELSTLVKDVIESANLMRGDLLTTTSEFRHLADLMEEMDINTSFESLRTLIDDTGRTIKAGFAEALANTSIEPIKNNTNLLLDKLDLTKSSINENSDKNLSKSLEKLEDISNLGEKIREIVTYLPESMKQTFLTMEDGQKDFVEKSSRDLDVILQNIEEIKNNLDNTTQPLRTTLVEDINELKDLASGIKDYIEKNESAKTNFQNLESLIAKVAGDYDVALHNVKNNLMKYLETVKENSESADIKMNNFAFEFNALKNELTTEFNNINEYSNSQNEKFNAVCNGLSLRFDAVLDKLAILSEQPLAVKDIRDGFEKVQQCVQDLLLAVSDIKINSNVPNRTINGDLIEQPEGEGLPSAFLIKFESKINKIKDQLNFFSTDLMENLYNRSENIIKEFEPIKKAVLSFVDVDFQNVASALKEQMDAYKTGMQEVLGEVSDENSRGVLNSLFTGLSSLETKIENTQKDIIFSHTNAITEIKKLLEQIKPLMPNQALSGNLQQNEINAQNNSSINELINILDEKIVDVKTDYYERVNDLKHFIEEITKNRFDNIDNKQNEILDKIESIQTKEEVITIKNQLNELFDKLSVIHDEFISNKVINPISENTNTEKYSDLSENDRNVIINFTKGLADLAKMVKLTSETIDAKITRAIDENAYNFNLDSLKSDISQILSKLEEGVAVSADIHSSNNDSNSNLSEEIKSLLDFYKSQILEEFADVKKSVDSFKIDEDFANDIKVVNQKLDLIVINDDVKNEINKSLQDIRNIVKDQQKFLNTVNILETLASLEDIAKLKGIQILEQLNDVVDTDKINSLEKLTLLDNLKNLDYLNELQNIPKLSKMIEIQNELKEETENLEQKLNKFDKTYSEVKLYSEDFRNELISAKTAIMKHVLNVFEQLSFVVEGEEIKDFVQEKTQEILNSIANDNSVQQEIKAVKHAIDSINPVEYEDIKEDLDLIKNLSQKLDSVENSIKENICNVPNLLDEKFNNLQNNFLEKTENINVNLTNLPEKIDENLNKIPQEFNEKLESIPQILEDRFNEYKKQLNLMRTGSTEDNNDYTYALQDVESDIARLRLAMEEVKKVVESNSLKDIADYVNEIVRQVDSLKFNVSQDDIFKIKVEIEKITTDIVSISSRTNKLLLASDESAQALNIAMSSFKNTVSDLYEGIKNFDYTEFSRKIENLSGQIQETNRQQKNINDSIAKLSVFAENTEESITDITETMNKLKKSMPSNESVLDELEVKFAKQQQKIDALEDKINELISLAEEQDSSIMSKKLNDIDKQLTRLNKSIEKLTSYVDEE